MILTLQQNITAAIRLSLRASKYYPIRPEPPLGLSVPQLSILNFGIAKKYNARIKIY